MERPRLFSLKKHFFCEIKILLSLFTLKKKVVEMPPRMKKAKSLKLDLNQFFFLFLLIFVCLLFFHFFGVPKFRFCSNNVISKDLGRITEFWKDLEENVLRVKMADNWNTFLEHCCLLLLLLCLKLEQKFTRWLVV